MKTTIKIRERELEVPAHIHALQQSAIDNLCRLPDVEERVLACGIDPSDSVLYMISGAAEVFFVRPNGSWMPRRAYPSEDGREIKIEFEHSYDLKSIHSDIALKNGKSCLDNATLHVNDNYVCDLELDGVAQDSDENQTKRTQEDNS